MKWKGRQGSVNIEDRRGGRSGGRKIPGGRVGGGLGCGGLIIILIIILLGGDPTQFLQQTQEQYPTPAEYT
ncbi:MAG: metalloprotease, partial [Flavobacteriales bacterium]|nr:metalloprotease [Flavobacteriales bacterium]